MAGRPPGFLSPRVNPEVLMMICTAGHVDHGKTQLVKLLTGCNTDRLQAEQERGLTIDLGFAPCFLGGELCVGIVDVPGHEKFVKNMVAGVSGIEFAVLVVAADDGIMPQTVEHLQIMELLGVRKGMVAMTKIDLVTGERVAALREEIAEFLKGTFLEGCPICPLSSETFEGYPEFYEILVAQTKGLARRRRCGVFRMPVERVFTQKGFGAVVTGIPVDGTISIGGQVELVPGDQKGKVRGIQRFLRDVDAGAYGQCLALNIPEFNKRPPKRGQVVCLAGYLTPSTGFHIRVTAVPGLEKPLRHNEEIKFHTGTVEEPGKIHFFEVKGLAAGQTVLASVALHNPVAAAPHDRFIIRRPSPAATLAGGEILDVVDAEQRPNKKQIVAGLKEYLAVIEGVDMAGEEGIDKRTEHVFRKKGNAGASAGEVSKATMLPLEVIQPSLQRLAENETILALSDDYFMHADNLRRCRREVETHLERTSKEEKTLSLTLSDLRQHFDMPAPVWNHVQQDLERRGVVKRRGDKLVLQAAVEGMSDADRRVMNRILELYDYTGYHSPRPEELPEKTGAPAAQVNRIVEYLCNEGSLIRLAKNVILSYDHLKKAQDMVVKAISEKGVLDSGDFKYAIDSTRKYALAILDYLDAQRVTVRIGNNRKLTADYQKHLV